MAETLFQLTLALARELEMGGLWEGTSSAASDTTITDATIGLLNSVVNGGTTWFRSGGAGITGATRIITTQVAGVVTFAPAIAMGVVEVLNYTLFGPQFPRETLRRAINQALRDLPRLATWDTSLVSVAFQEDYTLPTGVSGIKTVELAGFLTGVNLRYRLLTGWMETMTGTTRRLRFLANEPRLDGYIIRLGYNTVHPELTLDTEEVRGGINPVRLVYEAAAHAYLHIIKPRNSKQFDEVIQDLHNRALTKANQQESHTIETLPETPLFAGIGQRGPGSAGWPWLQ